MIWGKKYKEKFDPFKKHKWFAWYPVQLEDGRWCWWEYIHRTKFADRFSRTNYKYEVIK